MSQRLLMHAGPKPAAYETGRTRKKAPPMELQPLDHEYVDAPCVKCLGLGRYFVVGQAVGLNCGRVVYRCERCKAQYFSPRGYIRPGLEPA